VAAADAGSITALARGTAAVGTAKSDVASRLQTAIVKALMLAPRGQGAVVFACGTAGEAKSKGGDRGNPPTIGPVVGPTFYSTLVL
jgi:hypothetical protein